MKSIRVTIVTTVMLLLSLVISACQPGGGYDPLIFAPVYNNFSAEWWQWTYALPPDQHPLFDTADCSAGQVGDTWFLGGTYTSTPDPDDPRIVVGTADRDCAVPAETSLYIPILNAVCLEIDGDGSTEEALRACANGLINDVDPANLSATVNGVAMDAQIVREESALFTVGPFPENNLGEYAAGDTSLAVADGYFLHLDPLPAGEHRLDFDGKIEVFDEDGELVFSFSLDIGYDLTVGEMEAAAGSVIAEGTTATASIESLTFTPIDGGRCLVEGEAIIEYTGTISGKARQFTADIVEGPCDEATEPGVFDGNAFYQSTFYEGTVNGVDGTFDMIGRWSVEAGGQNYQGEIIIVRGYGELAGLQGVLIETADNFFDTQYSGRLHFDLTQ